MAERFDVIVVGYGFAGGNAAIAAADAGAKVLLLERMPRPGGISICSAGGLRVAEDAAAAFAYLRATSAGKTPDPVLRVLADGMVALEERVRSLATVDGAVISRRRSPGNYPLPGSDTFGFVYVEAVPGFDSAIVYPHVQGAPAGAMLFRLVEDNVRARPIEVRTASRVRRLLQAEGRVTGVEVDAGRIEAGAVVLACGGFEADPAMQAQYWPGGPALNAAFAGNTGDGIRMAQAAGADLWHMWHYHGSYGYRWPDPAYPYGIRVKRLPDWRPGDGRDLPPMAWILVDQEGRRFMNEYEPYQQDTGARPLGLFDPTMQTTPRNPAWLIVDAAGFALYPLGKPTSNDEARRLDWSPDNRAELAAGLFVAGETIEALAAVTGLPPEALAASLESWNRACAAGKDPDHGRPPGSMHTIVEPPFYAASIHPLVSNTQGGPVHDAAQRVLDPFCQPIHGLFAAGELGSAFGHLYISGGNLAECFIGGRLAGANAAG
jgi:succinate dehydrogenase/fumarate reductase flavoprotein subunit